MKDVKIKLIEGKMVNPYYRKKEIAKMFSMDPRSVDKVLAGVKIQIDKGRYTKYAIAQYGPRMIMVNALVFIDYLHNGDALEEKNIAKNVPPFSAKEVARDLGGNE